MKNLTKFCYCIVSLSLLILLLVGCTGSKNEESKSEKDTAFVSNSTTGSEKSANDAATDPSSENPKNEKSKTTSGSEEEKALAKDSSKEKNETIGAGKNSTNKETSEKENNNDNNGAQKNIHNANNQSDPQDAKKQLSSGENNQNKAVSLVKDYLRNQNDLVEDKNHFVEFEEVRNKYYIVRYSTLVSGHSSTNGRYAVDINNGKVIEITAATDLDALNE